METVSTLADTQSRSKSPTRKPKDLCKDNNHLNFRALEEQKKSVEEDSSPQPVIEEAIAPHKAGKETRKENQAVQHEEKASELPSKRKVDTLLTTPSGPIFILLESDSMEDIKEEQKALEEPKATKPVFEMVPKGLHTIIQEIAAIHHPETEVPAQTETKKEEADSVLVTHKGRLLSQRGKEKATSDETSLLSVPCGKDTASAMATSLSSFVVSPVGQVFADTIERALSKSEEWLNYYLPLPESNKGPSHATPGAVDTSMQDLCKEGCFMRINSLSTQLRNRAFKIVLHQIKAARQNTHENLSLLDQILDMQLELKAFLLTRDLARELYHTYHNLLPHISELPAHLQEKVTQIHENLEEMQGYLSSSTNLRDLPNSIVLQSRQKLATARENLDELLEFMGRNVGSPWLPQASSSRSGKELLYHPALRQREGTTSEQKLKAESTGSRQFLHPPPPTPPRP
ncbi:hypothetical protein E2320_000006 [Naja naja]|nr:hypothetical protein E2320_000006 [Naja naja]